MAQTRTKIDFHNKPDIPRWTPTVKKLFIQWAHGQPKQLDEALAHYNISPEEYSLWVQHTEVYGSYKRDTIAHSRKDVRRKRITVKIPKECCPR